MFDYMSTKEQVLKEVVIKFAGDSGDGITPIHAAEVDDAREPLRLVPAHATRRAVPRRPTPGPPARR